VNYKPRSGDFSGYSRTVFSACESADEMQ